VIFLGLFRLADNLVPLVFNRPFNLYLDTQRLPDLVLFGWALLSPAFFAIAVAGFALALPSVFWGVVRSLNILHDGLAATGLKSLLSCLAAGLIAAGAWSGFRPDDTPALMRSAALPRLAEEVRAILDLEGIRRRDQVAIEAAIERSRGIPTNLNVLNRAPVFLFVIESYGQTVFSDPDHAARVALVKATGPLAGCRFGMCSAYRLPDLRRRLLAHPAPGERVPEQPDPARPTG
jgi:hypothetical protein